MEIKKMSREKIRALFEPWAATTNEAIVNIIKALMNPGAQVTEFIRPNSQELGISKGAHELAEDQRRDP